MYQLNRKAFEKYQRAFQEGIVTDTEEQIIEIVLEQEIVSYCTSKGCVSFDYTDLENDEQPFGIMHFNEDY